MKHACLGTQFSIYYACVAFPLYNMRHQNQLCIITKQISPCTSICDLSLLAFILIKYRKPLCLTGRQENMRQRGQRQNREYKNDEPINPNDHICRLIKFRVCRNVIPSQPSMLNLRHSHKDGDYQPGMNSQIK